MRLLVCLALAATAVVINHRPAQACSRPLDFGMTEQIPPEGLTQVPVLGVVPIFMYVNDLAELLITVTDDQGTVVGGEFTIRGDRWTYFTGSHVKGRMIWHATQPLQPSTTYTMAIDSELSFAADPYTIQFTTRATDSVPAPTFSVSETQLKEFIAISEQVCCGDEQIDTCGRSYRDDCYAVASSTSHFLRTSVTVAAQDMRYFDFTVAVDGDVASDVHPQPNNPIVSAFVPGLSGEHCLSVTTTSVVDGSSHNEVSCASVADMLLDTPPELFGAGVCEEQLPDTESHGGCSVGSRQLPGALLVMCALIALGRRRRWLGLFADSQSPGVP